MARFDGEVAFITGASSGIGAALARELAGRGAAVALAARRTGRLEALAAELATAGRRALAVPCDVTRDGDVERALEHTARALGPVSVLVANAGFSVIGPLERLDLDDYRRQFEVNVFGVLRTVRAGLADLQRTRGRLLLMGSISGYAAAPGASAYAMSKFAVRALAQALRLELAPAGISVTLASPGFVRSEIHQVDNRGVDRPGVRHRAPAWLVMPAGTAARQIAAALARRRAEVVVTGHGRVMVFLARHLPGVLTWAFRRLGVRTRPEPGPG